MLVLPKCVLYSGYGRAGGLSTHWCSGFVLWRMSSEGQVPGGFPGGRVRVCMHFGPLCVLPQIAFIVLHINSTSRLKSYV